MLSAPQPGSLILRTALTDLKLKKRSRPLLAYTPAGLVAYGAVQALSAITTRVQLASTILEFEVLESGAELVLAEAEGSLGVPGTASSAASWDQLTDRSRVFGARMARMLDNSRRPLDQQVDCTAITTP